MRRKVFWSAVAMSFALTGLVLFVLLDSGPAAQHICDNDGGGAASLSWSPPGVACEFGEPTQRTVTLNLLVPVLLIGLVWPAQALLLGVIYRRLLRRSLRSLAASPTP
jgi:hypothetical protein